jgi:hypothetical protein
MVADKQGQNGNRCGHSVSMPTATKRFQDGSIHCYSNFANQNEKLQNPRSGLVLGGEGNFGGKFLNVKSI